MHAVVGPARSAASGPTAALLGARNITQVTYWSTAKSLNDLDIYPRFMRTIPIDDAVAFALCQMWKLDLSYTRAAALYSAEAYGEAYAASLVEHCHTLGIEVLAFPYVQHDEVDMRAQVNSLAATGVRVVLCIVMGSDVHSLLEEAYDAGSLGEGSMWVFSDSVTSSELSRTSAPVRQALHGSLRILAAGATAGNIYWQRFASDGWQRLDPATINMRLPAEWQLSDDFFTKIDAHRNANLRDIGTCSCCGARTCATAHATLCMV